MKSCKKLGQILSAVIPEGSSRILRRQHNGNSRKLRLERFADWLCDARRRCVLVFHDDHGESNATVRYQSSFETAHLTSFQLIAEIGGIILFTRQKAIIGTGVG